MKHSALLHPEFGLLCPRPRLRRELRIATTCLLFGAIAGVVCVSGVIALRHSDSASLESAAALSAAASRDVALGAAPGAASSAPRPELAARTSVPPASAEASAEVSQTSAQAAAIASKPRVVRVQRTFDSPAIARLPLGRSEPPAAASPPVDNPPASSQAVNAVAGDHVSAAASGKSVAQSGAKERTAAPPKKAQKTARNASPRRNDSGNDESWRDDRLYDWSARAAAVIDARTAIGRAYAREGSSSVRGFWDWSR